MTKIITFYNNIGGVSKTTTLFNLAVYLAEKYKVLLVDCDPQCSLTDMFSASSKEVDGSLGTSIMDALKLRISGATSKIDISSINLIKSEIYPNLNLLKGDANFSELESSFCSAWSDAITEDLHNVYNYTLFKRLLNELGEINNFKYVFCDLGSCPNFTTRNILLSCDGYFIPFIPDRFNSNAIKNFDRIFHKWIKHHKKVSDATKGLVLTPVQTEPLFLGGILFSMVARDPFTAKYHSEWTASIRSTIENSMYTKQSSDYSENSVVATIEFVGALALFAQLFGVAIFDMKKKHFDIIDKIPLSVGLGNDNRDIITSLDDWDSWAALAIKYKKCIGNIAEALRW